jgi:hypothetical protein
MNRIKVFSANMYENGDGVYHVQRELQSDIDKWLVANPTYNIISQSVALSKQEALLTVLYSTELNFERINKN